MGRGASSLCARTAAAGRRAGCAGSDSRSCRKSSRPPPACKRPVRPGIPRYFVLPVKILRDFPRFGVFCRFFTTLVSTVAGFKRLRERLVAPANSADHTRHVARQARHCAGGCRLAARNGTSAKAETRIGKSAVEGLRRSGGYTSRPVCCVAKPSPAATEMSVIIKPRPLRRDRRKRGRAILKITDRFRKSSRDSGIRAAPKPPISHFDDRPVPPPARKKGRYDESQ